VRRVKLIVKLTLSEDASAEMQRYRDAEMKKNIKHELK
jgi:hypothetical protein